MFTLRGQGNFFSQQPLVKKKKQDKRETYIVVVLGFLASGLFFLALLNKMDRKNV